LQSTAAWAKEKMEKAEEEEKEDKHLTKPPPVSLKTTTGELNYLNYIYT
jgi:hypothetical protein